MCDPEARGFYEKVQGWRLHVCSASSTRREVTRRPEGTKPLKVFSDFVRRDITSRPDNTIPPQLGSWFPRLRAAGINPPPVQGQTRRVYRPPCNKQWPVCSIPRRASAGIPLYPIPNTCMLCIFLLDLILSYVAFRVRLCFTFIFLPIFFCCSVTTISKS